VKRIKISWLGKGIPRRGYKYGDRVVDRAKFAVEKKGQKKRFSGGPKKGIRIKNWRKGIG